MSPYVPRHPDHDVELDDRADAPGRPGTIERDVECPHCGYNCRGIRWGSKCPECGGDPFGGRTEREYEVSAAPLRKLVDAMGVAGPAERRRWRTGLTLAALCVSAVIAARLLYFATAFVSAVGAPTSGYLVFGLFISAVWTVSVFLIMPASLDRHWPQLRLLRAAILFTQALWVPAYVFWIADVLGGTGMNASLLAACQYLLRALAGLGFIALGQYMVFICEEAGLETAARRFNTASWVIAVPTLLGQAFVGSIPWIALVLLFFVLAAWSWMLTLYVLGFLEMRRHVTWHGRHLAEAAGREERVAEKKRRYEAEATKNVRPDSPDLPDDHPLL